MRYIILFDKDEDCFIVRYTTYYESSLAMYDRYTPILRTDSYDIASKTVIKLNRGWNE